jgi:hypothetical protein
LFSLAELFLWCGDKDRFVVRKQNTELSNDLTRPLSNATNKSSRAKKEKEPLPSYVHANSFLSVDVPGRMLNFCAYIIAGSTGLQKKRTIKWPLDYWVY